MMRFILRLLSDYRTPLMGMAAVMIIFCHAHKFGVIMPNLMTKILSFGNLGVDIFLLLSGVGCYYSLSKLASRSVGAWYKRRLIRILIPYALMQVPFWTYQICVANFDLFDSLYVFSTLKFWTFHKGAWYVALLMPLYILTPPLYRLLQACRQYRLIGGFVLMLFIIIACSMDFSQLKEESVMCNLRWAFQRTASFVIGLSIAPYVKQGKCVNLWFILGICALSYFFVHKFVSDYVFMGWCQVPFFVVAFIYFFQRISNNGAVFKFLSWMGIVSLESYLANIYLCGAVSDFTKRTGWNDTGGYMGYLLVIVLGVFVSWGINELAKRVNKMI